MIERERSDDSRVRRREILDNLDRDMKRNPTLALARVEEAILLAVQEGLWEGIFWDFEKACKICCGWGDEESAEMWREPAKRAATLTWGDQISKILSSTVIDVEPKKTKIWDTFRIAAKTGKTQLKGPDPAFLRVSRSMFSYVRVVLSPAGNMLIFFFLRPANVKNLCFHESSYRKDGSSFRCL